MPDATMTMLMMLLLAFVATVVGAEKKIWAKFNQGDQRTVRDFLLNEPNCSETAVSLASKLGLRRGNTRRALDELVNEGVVRRRDFSDMASIYYRFPDGSVFRSQRCTEPESYGVLRTGVTSRISAESCDRAQMGGLRFVMSPNWRWCLKLGFLVVLIDLAAIALGRASGGSEDAATLAGAADNIANLIIFGYIGWRTGPLTSRATASAEAGVVASLLPAIAAALLQVFRPAGMGASEAGETVPLVNGLITAVATNIALGGVMAWLGGRLATRDHGGRPG